MSNRVSESRLVKLRLMWYEQDGRCALCEGAIDEEQIPFPARVNVDHVVPRARGGKSHPANLRLTHTRCNSAKADLPLEEFLARRLNPDEDRTPPPPRKERKAEVRFVREGLDEGARVVYRPREQFDEQPWEAEAKYGPHISINGKRFAPHEVVTAGEFDKRWKRHR